MQQKKEIQEHTEQLKKLTLLCAKNISSDVFRTSLFSNETGRVARYQNIFALYI